MNPPKCRLCNHEHWLSDPHVFATNKESATNNATNERLTDAGDNKTRILDSVRGAQGSRQVEVKSGATLSSGQVPVGISGDAGKTRNRRSREAYNAYQREYMRKRRDLHKEGG